MISLVCLISHAIISNMEGYHRISLEETAPRKSKTSCPQGLLVLLSVGQVFLRLVGSILLLVLLPELELLGQIADSALPLVGFGCLGGLAGWLLCLGWLCGGCWCCSGLIGWSCGFWSGACGDSLEDALSAILWVSSYRQW